MDLLKNSLCEHRTVTIIYLGKDNKITQRNIKVLDIKDENIKAYCYMKHQVRNFKKSSILSTMYTH